MNLAPDVPHVHPPLTRIGLRRSWDAVLERTTRLRPMECHAVLLDWQPERWPDDGGMPVEIALALASALTRLGTVMGRAGERNPAGLFATLIPAPRRTLFSTLRDGVLRRAPAAVLARTRDPIEAAVLLDSGWLAQGQAVLVLSSDKPPGIAIDALRYRRDWRDFHLEPPVKVLLVPSNDGDGAMFAAPSAAALAEVVAQVEEAFKAAGFLVGCHDQ